MLLTSKIPQQLCGLTYYDKYIMYKDHVILMSAQLPNLPSKSRKVPKH